MLLTEKPSNDFQELAENVELDPHNKRIKLFQWNHDQEFAKAQKKLQQWALENDCDKIIIYTVDQNDELTQRVDCHEEGKIDGFFQGKDAYLYSFFLSPNRESPVDEEQENKVLQIVEKDRKHVEKLPLPSGYSMRTASETDTEEMAKLYDLVFQSYPTPMNDPEFIKQMMNEDVYFTIVENKGNIISSCSADVFPEYNAAEMTDCATLPEHRGQGFLSQQFIHLEELMEEKGIGSLFSLSRSVSVGMNLINARHGYTFRGRMIQNSNISGRFEDMNIWVKTLS